MQTKKTGQLTRGAKLFLMGELKDGTVVDLTWKEFEKLKLPFDWEKEGAFVNALFNNANFDFNVKVEYNMWAKTKERTNEEKIEWMMNKRG